MIWLIIAFLVGGCFGFILCAIITSSKLADLAAEREAARRQWRKYQERFGLLE